MASAAVIAVTVLVMGYVVCWIIGEFCYDLLYIFKKCRGYYNRRYQKVVSYKQLKNAEEMDDSHGIGPQKAFIVSEAFAKAVEENIV